MFGLGTFGTLTFGQAPGAQNVFFVSVHETSSAVDAVSAAAIFACSVSETETASDLVSSIAVFSTNIFEVGILADTAVANFVGAVTVSDVMTIADEFSEAEAGVFGEFHLSGEATLEFVGTTKFIDMIEEGDSDLAIAAEIRTRSL